MKVEIFNLDGCILFDPEMRRHDKENFLFELSGVYKEVYKEGKIPIIFGFNPKCVGRTKNS